MPFAPTRGHAPGTGPTGPTGPTVPTLCSNESSVRVWVETGDVSVIP